MSVDSRLVDSPFSDLLIADISGTVATGYAGKLFADYGATVVNVEFAEGFSTRRLQPLLKDGNSALHCYLNANKQSVISDNVLIHAAVLKADLVLFDPSGQTRGASPQDIKTNVCAISWFGLNGPYSNYQGSDGVIHALTGLMRNIGEPGLPPIVPQGFQAQMIGGLSAFNGSLGYLMGVKNNPAIDRFCVDASIFEANMCLTDLGPIGAYNGGQSLPRMGINRYSPTYPLGIWPCKDGWLGVTCLIPSQWRAFCKLLGLDGLTDAPEYESSINRFEAADLLEPSILKALSEHCAEDLFYQGQAMRIPMARVPTMNELPNVDQYVQRQAFADYSVGRHVFKGPTVPYRLRKTPPLLGGETAAIGEDNHRWSEEIVEPQAETSNSATVVDDLPLTGIKIIDLTMGWAGPLTTRNLADMGATVIKVESCTRFDWFRSWEATQEWIDDNGAEKAPPYIYLNRNKLDITLDLDSDEGRTLLLQLIQDADALVENYSGGVLPKLKLGYEHLVRANPELVMLSMSAFGSTGPWSEFRAYGSTIEHSSGLPHLNGNEEQPPVMQHVAMGDAIAGLNGTAALLTALYHKKRTGKGQYVDLSQAECLFPHAAPGILHQSVHGEPPERTSNRHPDYAPQGVYPCAGDDEWIFIQIQNDVQWSVMCYHVPSLEPYAQLDIAARQGRHDEIDLALQQWAQNQDAAELMEALQRDGVSAATLNRAADLLSEPHLAERGYMQMVERDFVGLQPHPSAPWRVGEAPLPVRWPAPTLGQHNPEILQDMLGLSTNKISELALAGVVGSKPRLP